MKTKKIVTGLTMLALSTIALGACTADKIDDTKTSSTASSSMTSSSTTSSSTASSTTEEAKGMDLKDGTYTLKEKNDSNGYHAEFKIVVKDGKITESDMDYLDKDGKSKKDDTEYNEKMTAKSGIGPKEYIAKFNEELVSEMSKEDGNPGNIDVVTGATHSFHSFVLYAEQLINAAQKGDTKTIEVDNYVESK